MTKYQIFFLTLIFGVFSLNDGFPQEILIKESGITDADIDLEGNLYLADNQGSIIKLDPNGNKIQAYSSSFVSPVSSIDVAYNFKIMLFYEYRQACTILDRHFRELIQENWQQNTVQHAQVATFASDNSCWVFDNANFSLKKINLIQDAILNEIKLPLLIDEQVWDIQQLKEYENRLYLLNKNGNIYVFDNMGNFTGKLPVSAESGVGFYRNTMVYVEKGSVKTLNLYNREINILFQGLDTDQVIKVLFSGQSIYLVFVNCLIVKNLK